MRHLAIALTLAGAALGGCSAKAPENSQLDSIIWPMGDANVTGLINGDGIAQFRGIAYAKAPVGDLRWKAPVALDRPNGEIDATRFGAACPQGQGNPNWYRSVAQGFGAQTADIPDLENISEDCLTLNIWADQDVETQKPGMVWIHGGSNVNGFSHEPNYLGDKLAAKGVVVVSLNYRMGALGFLPHRLLDQQDTSGVSGYYGLADQVAALTWVQDNIAAFGGNPDNVTVFGESAGGGNISALLRMPSATGLFHRAAIQSGALAPYDAIAYDTAQAAGEKLFTDLEASTLDEMRALDWATIVERTPDALPDYYFGPVADGATLPGAQIVNPVPLLIGANADEMLMYLDADDPAPFETAATSYAQGDGAKRAALKAFFAGTADAGTADAGENNGDALMRANKMSSAAEFFCPALSLAMRADEAGAPVFFYYFTRTRPDGNMLGAYHGAEIPYVFDTADDWLPHDETDTQLTKIMQDYWINFARTGTPNGPDEAEAPAWLALSGAEINVQELGAAIGPTLDHPAGACSLFNSSN